MLWGVSLALKMEKVPSKRLSKKRQKKHSGKYPQIVKKWPKTGQVGHRFLGTFLIIFGYWFLGVPPHQKIQFFWLKFIDLSIKTQLRTFLGTFLIILGYWFLGVPPHQKIMFFWLKFIDLSIKTQLRTQVEDSGWGLWLRSEVEDSGWGVWLRTQR